MHTMKTAISYIRFSTKIQSGGDSTKRQSKYIQDWLARNPDYYLDDKLKFEDLGISGYSGANAKSGDFGEFLAAVEKDADNHPIHIKLSVVFGFKRKRECFLNCVN